MLLKTAEHSTVGKAVQSSFRAGAVVNSLTVKTTRITAKSMCEHMTNDYSVDCHLIEVSPPVAVSLNLHCLHFKRHFVNTVAENAICP